LILIDGFVGSLNGLVAIAVLGLESYLTDKSKAANVRLPHQNKTAFMSAPTTGDRLEYLSDYHEKDQRWETSKSQSDIISAYYTELGVTNLGDRISRCANRIGAALQSNSTGEVRLKIRSVYLCHVRHCMVCQKARTMGWYRRFQIGLPNLFAAYPKAKYVLLTLTLKNCPIGELRDTLQTMSAAFKKLMARRGVDRVLLGCVRTMEVTKSKIGEAHPHFHVLLALKPNYFGKGYITQDDWATMWQESLEVDYKPVVDVRKIKLMEPVLNGQLQVAIDRTSEIYERLSSDEQDVRSAVRETVKYQVKGSDLVGKGTEADKQWLVELTKQLDHTKQVNMSGIFREFIKEVDATEREAFEASLQDTGEFEDIDLLFFNWFKTLKRYARVVS